MKLITTLIAVFALLSIASPSQAQVNINFNVSGGSSGLPPTNLDSFVYQSGMNPNIYGDEGSTDIPPLNSFEKQNRINAGIVGQDAAGLTTGHGSWMPDAWGADEFLAPPGEWDMSGAGTSANSGTVAVNLNATQAAQAALLNSYNPNTGPATTTTSTTNVNGAPMPPATPPTPVTSTTTTPTTSTTPTTTTSVPAWIAAFGAWATAPVPYAVTQGMVPVQNQTTGALMGWMAPGQSLSQFLNGSTGLLLPSEATAAQALLQNLSSANDYVVPGG